MPYSKDPRKYPPEFESLLAAFATDRPPLPLAQTDPSAAIGVRLQLQSYFNAVVREEGEMTRELRASAARVIALERQTLGSTQAQSLVHAQVEHARLTREAEHWAGLAKVAAGLMVKLPRGSCTVTIQRRGGGALAAQIMTALGEGNALPALGIEQLAEQIVQWRTHAVRPDWAESGDVEATLLQRFGDAGRDALERATSLMLVRKAFADPNWQKLD